MTWHKLTYYLIIFFLRCLGRIPKSWAGLLGRALGRCWYRVDSRRRKIALNNLRLAFGREKTPRQIERLAERVFENIGLLIFEIGWSLGLTAQDIPDHFRLKGFEHFQKAAAKGKGILILTGHIGNWELLSVTTALVETPVNIVYRPLDFSPLEDFFVWLRTRFGARMIARSKRAMFSMFKALHRAEIVVILLDQNVGWTKGVFAEFFGRRAATHKVLTLLALKTEAPVVPLFMIRQPDGFVAEFGREIPLIKTGDQTKDIDANTQQYNDVIESVVRRYPDQWFWVHQRWKTRPYKPWPRGAPKKESFYG